MADEERASRGTHDEVALTIQRFDPTALPPDEWQIIAPLVRGLVSQVDTKTAREATELLGRTASLLDWAFRQGMELSAEAVLSPDVVDRFIREACAHLATGTQTNYRRLLWRVGAAVLGPRTYRRRSLSLPKSP